MLVGAPRTGLSRPMVRLSRRQLRVGFFFQSFKAGKFLQTVRLQKEPLCIFMASVSGVKSPQVGHVED